MKVVAHPLIVAVALGLLAPTALATEAEEHRTQRAIRDANPLPEDEEKTYTEVLSGIHFPEVVSLKLD